MDRKYVLPERLAQIRNKKELSQYEAAKALGFSRGQLANYEQGSRRPEPLVIQQIASFYNVSTDWLLGLTDDARPAEKIIADSTDSRNPEDNDKLKWLKRDTPPTDMELEEFLKTANVYFNGTPLNDDDKEDILAYLRFRWEREREKREKEQNQ